MFDGSETSVLNFIQFYANLPPYFKTLLQHSIYYDSKNYSTHATTCVAIKQESGKKFLIYDKCQHPKSTMT